MATIGPSQTAKELERENTQLKKLADQALDNMILKEVPRETSEPVPTPPGRGACLDVSERRACL